ncbi:ATP-binding protein [Streptomyces albus]|uniref:ATP-binding protein n=1 Tax=Streptomyces sp. PHES57 TaxID=2872626 RepID=UPI001CEC98E4|nr:ATP-binding protein [Streptomyces sp. PHES57]
MRTTEAATAGEDAYTALLDRTASSAAAGRSVIVRALSTWNMPTLADDGASIVTEMIANAVQHAQGDYVRVTVFRSRTDRVRIAVADRSPEPLPAFRAPHPDAERGRGLRLIAALAHRWGTDRLPWGKQVWAELETPQPHASLAAASPV